MTSPSGTAQATLRNQIKALIALLAQLEFEQAALDRAFAANKALIGDGFRPRQKQPGYAATFERLFCFKGNARKYLGTEQTPARVAIEFRHVRCIWGALTALGFRLGAPLIDAGPAAWSIALTRAATAVANGLDDQEPEPAASPELIAHPRWRLVERPDIAAAILDRLEAVGAVALTGMPGIGKTVLARQVLASAERRDIHVCAPDAGYWQPTTADAAGGFRPSAVGHVGLWAAVLRQVARLPAPSLTRTQRGRFDQAVATLVQHWTEEAGELTEAERQLVEGVASRPRPASLAQLLVTHATALRSLKLTAELSGVLRTVSPDAIVLLDNVTGIEAARSTCVALFGRDQDGRPSPLKLLLTSQRAADDLGFLVAAEAAGASAKLVDFEDRRFARKVVAAWSVSGDEDRTQREAEAGIEIFRVTRMAQDAALSADIDRVIARVGGHALALAALASVWRYGGHRRNFWRQALATIQAAPSDILQFEVPRDPDRTIEPWHADVLQALRLAWALLDDGRSDWQATRERFLDLGVSRPNQPIDENIFNEFWKRAARGPRRQRLSAMVAPTASPLRRLQAASFVQPLDGGTGKFILHDLHRILIGHELGGRAGIAARHREFLHAFGWLDADGSLRTDEATQYTVENGRTELRPDLGLDADAAEITKVGRYLLEALPHHLQGAAPEAPEPWLVALATSYRFLQAKLDAADGDAHRLREQGNIASLAVLLQRQTAQPLPLIRHAVRLAAEGLAKHRRQLPGQFLARIPVHHHPALDGLRNGASRHGLRPSFAPRFPFLVNAENPLRAQLSAERGFKGAEWIGDRTLAPLVLAWTEADVVLWDPELCKIHLSFPHGGRIDRARWIADAPGGPAILGWSFMWDGIVLWDAWTGVPRLEINADHALNQACWIGDAPGGPAILSWSRSSPSPICLWDARSGEVRLRFPRSNTELGAPSDKFEATWLATASNGPAILGWSTTDRMIRVWDVGTGDERPPLLVPDILRGVTWISDAIGVPGILSWSSRGGIRVWNALTGVVQRHWLPLSHEPSEDTEDGPLRMCGARWLPDGPVGPAVLWWSFFDRQVRLWDAASGKMLAGLPHEAGVADARWIATAPGGPLVLTRSREAIHLWDGRTGQIRGSVHDECAVMEAHWVPATSDSPPCIMSRWRDGTIRFYDCNALRERTRIAPQKGVTAVAWIDVTPDGPAIMTSSSCVSGNVCLWSPVTKACALKALPRHTGQVEGVAWLPTKSPPSEIMSWSSDHTVRVWGTERGEERLKVAHEDNVSHASWIATTPAGSAILSCSDDRTIRLWAGSNGKELVRTEIQSRFRPSGLAWTNNAEDTLTVMIWHFHAIINIWCPWGNCKDIEIRHENVCDVQLVDDVFGTAAIFSRASNSAIVCCWDAATGHDRGRFRAPAALKGVAWIPDAPEGPAILGWAGDYVVLWDAADGQKRFEVRHDREVSKVKWIADAWGKPAILSSSHDNTIRLWDISGEERLRICSDQHAPSISWINETPTGPAILSWSVIENDIVLWDLETKQKRVRVHHDERVQSALWLADSSQPAILSWAEDHTIRLWDANTSDMIARFDLDSMVVSAKIREPSRKDFELAFGCTDGTVGCIILKDL